MIWRLLAGVGLLALAGFLLTRYGAARYDSGRLAERVAWQEATAKADARQAAHMLADERRVTGAVAAYAARMDALEPIVLHNREVVREYAQTDAGRAMCLGADRVRSIEESAARLGLETASPASKGDGPMLAYIDSDR